MLMKAASLGLMLLSGPALGDLEAARRLSYEVLPRASARMAQYNTIRYTLSVAGLVWYLAGLFLVVRLQLGQRVLEALPRGRSSVWLGGMAVWAAYVTAMAIWSLPLALTGTLIERAYGFSTIAPGLWIRDRCLDWAFSLIWAPLIPVALIIVNRFPHSWWLVVGAVLTPVAFLLVIVYPVVVDRAYNRFTPLQDEALRQRLMETARKAGVENPEILVVNSSARTRKQNAYVTGLGPTKRIVIWDNTLKNMDPDMVVAVTAHELGHYALNHIWWGLLLQTVGLFIILWIMAQVLPPIASRYGPVLGVRGMTDPAVVPLAMLVLEVLLILQTPIAAAISRTMERRADMFALETCRDGKAMARALATFSTRDYGDPDPPRWYVYWAATHPPLRERVTLALDWSMRSQAK